MKPDQTPDNKPGFDLNKLKKKNVFQVPDRYFDELPTVIQSRAVTPSDSRSWWSYYGLRLALPSALVLLIGIYFGILQPGNEPSQPESYQALLEEVSDEDLVAFLEDSELTTDEIIASADLENWDDDFYDDPAEILEDIDFEEVDLDEITLDINNEGSYN